MKYATFTAIGFCLFATQAYAQQSGVCTKGGVAYSVPLNTICSIGPLAFNGICGTPSQGSTETDIALEVANPESQAVMLEGASVSVVVSQATAPFRTFIGDSDSPDPVASDVYGTPAIDNNYYAVTSNKFPAGYGMQWLPGSVTDHHVDVHVNCSDSGIPYGGTLSIYYYAPTQSAPWQPLGSYVQLFFAPIGQYVCIDQSFVKELSQPVNADTLAEAMNIVFPAGSKHSTWVVKSKADLKGVPPLRIGKLEVKFARTALKARSYVAGVPSYPYSRKALTAL